MSRNAAKSEGSRADRRSSARAATPRSGRKPPRKLPRNGYPPNEVSRRRRALRAVRVSPRPQLKAKVRPTDSGLRGQEKRGRFSPSLLGRKPPRFSFGGFAAVTRPVCRQRSELVAALKRRARWGTHEQGVIGDNFRGNPHRARESGGVFPCDFKPRRETRASHHQATTKPPLRPP